MVEFFWAPVLKNWKGVGGVEDRSRGVTLVNVLRSFSFPFCLREMAKKLGFDEFHWYKQLTN